MSNVLTILGVILIFAVVIVFPAIILLKGLDWLSTPKSSREPFWARATVKLPVMIFGVVTILFGGSIIVWVIYNTLWERQDEYSGPSSILGGFSIGPACIAFGVMILRIVFTKNVAEQGASLDG